MVKTTDFCTGNIWKVIQKRYEKELSRDRFFLLPGRFGKF